MILWLFAAILGAGATPDTTLTFVTPSDGVIRVALRSALVGRDTGVTVEVKNGGDSDRRVVIRCEALRGTGVGDSLLAAQPETLLVPAHTSAATRVALPPALATLPPGVYLSAVVATAGPATVRRQLVVTVDRLPPLMLIGSAWTVRVVREFPFVNSFYIGRSALLPVPADADTGLLGSRTDSIGTALAGPMGAVAYAYRRNAIARLAPGVLGVPLAFDHLTTAGDYTGPLTLVPGLPDSKLALTVRVTDFWFWPALAIAIGILLAFALQRYTTVDRAVWQLKADVLRAAGQWDDAQAQYARALAPTIGAAAEIKYELGASYLKECHSLLSAVDALGQPLLTPLDNTNDAYKAAQQRLATLQGCLTDWPLFAHDLNTLAQAIQNAQSETASLQLGRPAVLATALDDLHGGPITVAGFAAARAAVTNMSAFLADWVDCAQRVADDRARITVLTPHVDAKHKPAFDTMRGLVAQASNDLQLARSADELKRRDTQKTLDSADGQLAQLGAVLLPTPALPAKQLRIVGGGETVLDEGTIAAKLRRETEAEAALPPLEQAKRLKDKITAADYFFLVLTLAIAVLTGFKALYLGQNTFGTVADYIAAILWGFGTRYTLDTFVTVVGHFFQRASHP
jgi:hypothetical protein